MICRGSVDAATHLEPLRRGLAEQAKLCDLAFQAAARAAAKVASASDKGRRGAAQEAEQARANEAWHKRQVSAATDELRAAVVGHNRARQSAGPEEGKPDYDKAVDLTEEAQDAQPATASQAAEEASEDSRPAAAVASKECKEAVAVDHPALAAANAEAAYDTARGTDVQGGVRHGGWRALQAPAAGAKGTRVEDGKART